MFANIFSFEIILYYDESQRTVFNWIYSGFPPYGSLLRRSPHYYTVSHFFTPSKTAIRSLIKSSVNAVAL